MLAVPIKTTSIHTFYMVSRQYKKVREEREKNALKRYQKDRQRNILATPGVHQVILVLDHLKAGFNTPKIFRTAEALGAHEIHLVNIGKFDPAPAKGGFRKVPAKFFDSFAESYQQLRKEGYHLFALEAGCSQSLLSTTLPLKSAFILGNEGLGISFQREDYPDIECISIPHYGETESLNVSVAASIVMFEYVRQHHQTK